MKIIIPIQSVSDVVTNSSSELFCTIFSETQAEDIYKLFEDIFGYNTDSDLGPVVYLVHKSDDDYYQEDERYASFPESWVEIHTPYEAVDHSAFYTAGIKALLKEHFTDYQFEFE